MSEPSHQQARRMIQRRRLTSNERRALRAHVSSCDACREYANVHVYLARHLMLAPARGRPPVALQAAVRRHARRGRPRLRLVESTQGWVGLAILALIILLSWALGGAPPRPITDLTATPATTTPTSSPTPSPSPRPTLVRTSPTPAIFVTTPEEIVGTWMSNAYYQFLPDGTYKGGHVLRDLEESPQWRGRYWFEGNRFFLQQMETETTVLYCDAIGIYELHRLANGSLRLLRIEDNCGPRRPMTVFEPRTPVE